MHDVGYAPKAIMAQSAGFAEQAFIDAVGPLAEGAMSRSAFALDAAKARPAIPAVNALYRARNNKDLNDNTGREITALIVLVDAINRAGSTDAGRSCARRWWRPIFRAIRRSCRGRASSSTLPGRTSRRRR